MRWVSSIPAYFAVSSKRGDEVETEATATREPDGIPGANDQEPRGTSSAHPSSAMERQGDEMPANTRVHQPAPSASKPLTPSTAEVHPPFILSHLNDKPIPDRLNHLSRSEVEYHTALNANLKEQALSNAELQKAYQKIEKLQADLVEAQKREQSKGGQLLQAQNEVQHLKTCLDDCKDQIFRMQPIEYMTDSQIGEQYVALCEAISDWTDRQFGELEDPISAIAKIMNRPDTAQVIDEFFVGTGYLQIASYYPSLGCIILTVFIHLYWHHAVLHEEIFFPGLNPAWQGLVSFVEHGMRTSQPSRGNTAL
jgi:hypothetical protein